jgi:hypothetical protein
MQDNNLKLSEMSIKKLKEYAKENNIVGYSNKSKDELISMITNNIEKSNKIDTIKIKLEHILDSKDVNHRIEILKQDTLKDAHIYCKVNNLSGQVLGPLIENYIKTKYCMEKNKPSLCVGDLIYNKVNFEIKVSNGGKENNKFNFVQIRMNHICDYILTAYYIDKNNLNDLGELFIFRLNKNDIKKIIIKYGHYAHGTIQKLGKITQDDLDDITNDKEYAIRPIYADKCWNELLNFRIDKIGIQPD